MRLLLPYREKEKASFGPASFTPYNGYFITGLELKICGSAIISPFYTASSRFELKSLDYKATPLSNQPSLCAVPVFFIPSKSLFEPVFVRVF